MQEHFLKIIHFEYWANKKVLKQIQAQSHPADKALQLFSHLIFVQKIWLNKIGISQEDIRPEYSIKEFAGILDNSYVELIAFIKRQKDFNMNFTYNDLEGNTHQNTLSDILVHVYVHGAYHRGQIVQLLKQKKRREHSY